MALTRDYQETLDERVKKDPEFARALLDEAFTLFLDGEHETARLTLRDLIAGSRSGRARYRERWLPRQKTSPRRDSDSFYL
jgi:hypothetical protein